MSAASFVIAFAFGLAFGAVLGAELAVMWMRPRLAECRRALLALDRVANARSQRSQKPERFPVLTLTSDF